MTRTELHAHGGLGAIRRQAAELHDRAARGGDDAETQYRLCCSATGIDPDFAQGWVSLGHRLNEIGQLAASLAAYRRALECPEDGQPGSMTTEMRAQVWCNIALRLHHLGEDGAETAARAALALDPGMAFAWTNLAMIWTREGRLDEAVDAGRRAFALGPEMPENELGLAFPLLFGGKYAEGLARFESRFEYKLRQYMSYPYPRWTGAVDRDATVLVVAEQGLGDTLSFARFIPAAARRVGRLIYAVQPELVRLLGASLAGAAPNVEVVPYPKTFPMADFWYPVCSLPVALGLTDAEIGDAPGLPAFVPAPPAGWMGAAGRFRIGICWAGSPANDIDKWRSLAGPEPFLALYRVPGVELYSFQVGERAKQLHTCGAVSLIRDLGPWIRDVADAAAILAEMDLVVTAETFLGHLAGFLGKRCWVLDSWNGGDWRLGRRGHGSIWYPGHTVFRQGADAGWGPVWETVLRFLATEVGGRRSEQQAAE